MNSWNTLPESNHLRVYNNPLATVKGQIRQAENPTPATVISVAAAHVDNTIRLEYFPSEVALEEPEISSSDPNIPIDNNFTDDKLHFGIPGGSGVYEDESDESTVCDAILTASRWRRHVTELERFDLGTSDVYGYEGKDGDDGHADEEKEASQADDGLTQNVED